MPRLIRALASTRVRAIHVVALFVGDHLERQLVVIAQKDGPLAGRRQQRRLLQNVDDRRAVFALHGHEQPRHEREVEVHVAFVAVAEIRGRVLRPLVRLGQQHLVAELLVDVRAQLAQKGVRLRQVLAIRAFALEEIRHRVEPQAVDAHLQPEVEHVEHRLADFRIVEVEVRLMAVKAVPEIRAGDRVPAPVRRLEILKDDPRFLVLLRRVAPHVPVAPARAGRRAARALKPLVLVGRVVHHQLGDDAQLAAMGFVQKRSEIVERAVLRIHVRVIGDVVAVVLERRRKERQQPNRRDAQVLDVIEPLGQAAEVADAVAVAVAKRAHVQLVDDRVLVPQRWSRPSRSRLRRASLRATVAIDDSNSVASCQCQRCQ